MLADTIVFAALGLAGLSAGGTPEAFDAAIFPFDTPAQAREMACGQSCCGTCCECILRRAGVNGTMVRRGRRLDWLRAPYALRVGSAITYQRELGQLHGCWVDATRPTSARPEPACMVEVEGPAHVLTLTGTRIDERGRVIHQTIEGGQPDGITGEDSAILLKQRVLSVQGGRLYLDDRRVVGWLRAGDLPCL